MNLARLLLFGALSGLVGCSESATRSRPSASGGATARGGSGGTGGSGGDSGTAAPGGSGSTSGGEAGGAEWADGACAAMELRVQRSPPAVIVFAVDTSAPLVEKSPGSEQSRWEVTRDALLRTLDACLGDLEVGLVLYPSPENDDLACSAPEATVPIALLDEAQRGRLTEALLLVEPAGEPTTQAGFEAAWELLATHTGLGHAFVHLVTSDLATTSCMDGPAVEAEAPLVADIRSAHARGIATGIVGLPETDDTRQFLSRLALAGGTAYPWNCSSLGPTYCHYEITTPAGLGNFMCRFAQIPGQDLPCAFPLPLASPGSPVDVDTLSIVYLDEVGAETPIERDESDGACDTGWHYLAELRGVELCGAACELLGTPNFSLRFRADCRAGLGD